MAREVLKLSNNGDRLDEIEGENLEWIPMEQLSLIVCANMKIQIC